LAAHVLEEMRGLVLLPDIVTYTSAMNACQGGHTWDESLQLFHFVCRSACQPNLLTYNALLSACERALKWEHALAMLGNMHCKDMDSHFAVLSALVAAQQMQTALQLYRRAVEQGVIRPWRVHEPGVLDLHGFPAEVAKIAVRAAVLDAITFRTSNSNQAARARAGALTGTWLVIIVGLGKRGIGESVLRPAVSHMLEEEFGLECQGDDANPGRVRVSLRGFVNEVR